MSVLVFREDIGSGCLARFDIGRKLQQSTDRVWL